MQLTLKREAIKPAVPSFMQQQARFDAFVARYNDAQGQSQHGVCDFWS